MEWKEILLNRNIDIRTDNVKIMRKAAKDLPKLLNRTIKASNVDSILSGADDYAKQFSPVLEYAPYLIRRPNTKNAMGVVRFSKCEKSGVEYLCKVHDYMQFPTICKYDNEKMQMFSVVYRAWESWHEEDTDGEIMKSEEIRKAIMNVAKNGFKVGLNIEHQGGTEVSKNDAMILEIYQARSSWYEGGLEVRKDDMVSTTQFFDTPRGRDLWKGLKKGEFTTYSLEGYSDA